MQRDNAHLLDIVRAARTAIEFRGGASKSEFLADLKSQSAVFHQLLIVGEAVKRLSPEFRQSHPEVPWKRIAGMRDKMIHVYDGVDLEEVWNVLENELTPLIQSIQRIEPSIF